MLAQRLGEDLGLRRVGVLIGRRRRRDLDVGLALPQLVELHALEGLDDQPRAAVVAAADAVDLGEHRDRVQIRERRVLGLGLALRGDGDDRSDADRIDQGQRARTPDGEGRYGARQQYATA